MASVASVTTQERAESALAAVEMARGIIGEGRGFVPPNARVGTLSDWEWQQIAVAAVSGWVAERSRQLGADRVIDERFFLATGEMPEPYDLGVCALALPALGDLVEKLGLGNKAIGEWRREHVLLFVWTAAELVAEARARNDERPEPSSDAGTVPAELYAG